MSAVSYMIELIDKKILTHDVYELCYKSQTPLNILPGQFLLCDTDATNTKLRRSYSVSWAEWNMIYFIVKRIADGGGGSIALCDQPLGHLMEVRWPMGQFYLRDTPCPKVFIGTGTGFAPLYFQLRTSLMRQPTVPTFFLFGVREFGDVFYQSQLEQWYHTIPAFDYEIFLSREELEFDKYNIGRVTTYLIPESIAELNSDSDTEFYICGSPAMVTEVRNILKNAEIAQEKVFFEQY